MFALSNKSTLTAALALASLATPALASSTVRYNCRANFRDHAASTTWIYDFTATGTAGTSQLHGQPLLTVTKAVGSDHSDDGAFTTIIENSPLVQSGTGASYLAFNLPASRHGLSVNFYFDAPTIIVFHTLAPDQTVVSEAARTACTVEEIG